MLSVASTCFLQVSARRAGVGTFMQQIPILLTERLSQQPIEGGTPSLRSAMPVLASSLEGVPHWGEPRVFRTNLL